MFSKLQKEVWMTAHDKGWHTIERSFPEYIVLMHSELSEALEEYRSNHGTNEIYYSEGGKPEGIPIEIADVLIRIFECAHEFGIDLDEAWRIKTEFNKTRPFRHGGKAL
jgi:NTP pyrophosphatase (non-canonical NTP hydrolase)